MRAKEFIARQVGSLLASRQRTYFFAVVLAMLPYCAWMAMALMALLTLRKGEQEGGQLLLIVVIAHTLVLMLKAPWLVALVNSAIFFIPCYIAACVLRISSSWQVVAGVLFLLTFVTALAVQWLVPQWVMEQYHLLHSLLMMNPNDPIAAQWQWLSHLSDTSERVMANGVFGLQLLSAVLSVSTALMVARALQARLYNPHGFMKEMLNFRGSRLSTVVFMVLGVATWQLNSVAMDVIPVLGLFYLMTGLSVCAHFMIARASRLTGVLLILPLVLVPFVMGPLYITMGLLDSLFDLRVAFRR